MNYSASIVESNLRVNPAAIKDKVQVFAPATVANMICGFDILGFAVDYPGDEVVMHRVEEPGVRIRSIVGDEGRLPLDADKNTVASVRYVLLSVFSGNVGSGCAAGVPGITSIWQSLTLSLTSQQIVIVA